MDAASDLREHGVVVLRGVFAEERLAPLMRSAAACFAAIDGGDEGVAARYRFTPYSYSVVLAALTEFGCVQPFIAGELSDFLAESVGEPVALGGENSWVRKRFSPRHAPTRYHPNVWHQDGGLGAPYGPDPAALVPMTRLLTCWVPLRDCGRTSPGLEFVRSRLGRLLHYTELDDAGLRRRYATEQFWAPELALGDAVVFHADTLHRTYVVPEMTEDRLSVEYRFFPE